VPMRRLLGGMVKLMMVVLDVVLITIIQFKTIISGN